ncbi:glycosyl hydrolase family 97 [Pontibacter ummariensis]|uniref:Glycosyl-hydrolase 97 C-terminal, oligomerisation n=1 Tax=Pontibacter ummariensis TaxID=1610492 RepID=A0A239K1L8_9BACT|nr:glycoside hydrolase family 97 protein [Pontibacter ummariensis]PRY06832.1 glycosyl hydrolase family 97 [Pontibacter ummariensis]SNT11920.1 Glycosyl-hydrolase 97 C-terminal, oligomerisation [Pontibacter ummariensis]
MNLKEAKRSLKLLVLLFTLIPCLAQAQNGTVKSPDGKLQVEVLLQGGQPYYRVMYGGDAVLEDSPLGLVTNLVDYSRELTWGGTEQERIEKTYRQDKIKQSEIFYQANKLVCSFKNKDGKPLKVEFRVSNNDIAFRYDIPESGDLGALVVEREATGFNFPQQAKGFLTPQSKSMVGFARTKPSYEEGYKVEQDISAKSANGLGYTFPSLFKVGEKWALVSETGVRGLYCGSHLSDPTPDGTYTIAFPDETENNGFGSTGAAIGLPATTPWRTITVGKGLEPIVETTIPYDVVEPLYEPSQEYKYGKGTWSWIMWQDQSMNYEDQVKYIDLAEQLNYEYVLIDAWWDQRIGYKRMEELIEYARSKDVGVFLWYNSNGAVNDAPQTPINKMNTAIARKKEMQWMKENGVKGIKVDFFGGDKQETMRLYEDILSDANDYGLMVVFHGTTLPRGWERMFPNYVGSEAVLASENLMFSQHANDMEAFHATLHPFIRNAVGSMEFGGVVLNKRYNRTNDGGNYRKTTDVFQLATAVLFQNPVQFFALTPNNLNDAPDFAIDFMKQVPTTWEETMFIDGYPGKSCVLARQHGDKWYVAGVNALSEPVKLKLSVPMLSGKEVKFYGDKKDGTSYMKRVKVNKKGELDITIQPRGGVVLEQ